MIDVERATLNTKVHGELMALGMADDEFHDILLFTHAAVHELASHHMPTAEHCLNVARLMALMIWESGGKWEDVKQAFVAGLLHDLGKQIVAHEILDKPPLIPFTEGESRNMRLHVTGKSPEIMYFGRLGKKQSWWRSISLAMMGHHLKPNGQGYGSWGLQTPGRKYQIDRLTTYVHLCDYLDATGRNDRLENVGKSEQALLDEAIDNLKAEGFYLWEVEKLRYVAEKAQRLDIRNQELVLPTIQKEMELNLFRKFLF